MLDDSSGLDENLAAGLQPSVVEALETWQTSTGNQLVLEGWMTSGHTRARVAVVLVTGAGPPLKLILKVCPPDRLTSREPRLHAQALADSPPDFATRHLVEQPFDTIECSDKWRVLFQSIAGDSLQTIRPLESVLHDDRLPELVEVVGTALLREWNPTFETRQVTPNELVRADLGSKIDRNGPLAEFARELDFENAMWLRFSTIPRDVVPNALSWVLQTASWSDE